MSEDSLGSRVQNVTCNWHKEMISKSVKGKSTNLEWDEFQIKKSYLKVENILRPELLYYFKSK